MQKLILIFFLCSVSFSFAQEQKAGAYLNYQDFKDNNPDLSDSLLIINKRSDIDILSNGGNEYIVGSRKKEQNKILDNIIWGVYLKNVLYLNSKLITGVGGYAKVETIGRYSVVNPSFPVNYKNQKNVNLENSQKQYFSSDDMAGLVVGNAAGIFMGLATGTFVFFYPAPTTITHTKQFPIIYDMKTKEMMMLNKPNVEALLEDYHNLINRFTHEESKEDAETLLKYVKLLNEIEK